MTESGIVIFEKSWEKDTDASRTKWGGLIRVVDELAREQVGLPVSYIETSNGCISIAIEPKSKLISALFHTTDCSPDLGSLIATEFLHTFYRSYHPSVNFSKAITNKGQFASFSSKIVDAMKKLYHTILANSLHTPGIRAALLVFDDGSEPVVKGSLADDISVLANFKAFLTSTTQIMNMKKDKPNFMSLEFEDSLVIIQRLSSPTSLVSSLVCVCKKRKKAREMEEYAARLQTTHRLLTQLFRILSYYTT